MAIVGTGLLAGFALDAGPVNAAPKIVEKVEYYEIGGKTGAELLIDMNRKGPRHGFLTRAIAQTQINSDMKGDMRHADGVCRVVGGAMTLNLTYVYPKPSTPLRGDLARRWDLFQADNVRHEKMHGRIAREMAVELDARLRGFAMKDGPGCGRAILAWQREFKAIVARHNLRQKQFDAVEHRDGGMVEKSILILVGKPGASVATRVADATGAKKVASATAAPAPRPRAGGQTTGRASSAPNPIAGGVAP